MFLISLSNTLFEAFLLYSKPYFLIILIHISRYMLDLERSNRMLLANTASALIKRLAFTCTAKATPYSITKFRSRLYRETLSADHGQ